MDQNNSELMIDYLRNNVLKNATLDIREDTPLVTSGLMDSFALIDVLLKLEKLTGRRIPASRVSPQDLDTVAKMFATADRVGKQQRIP